MLNKIAKFSIKPFEAPSFPDSSQSRVAKIISIEPIEPTKGAGLLIFTSNPVNNDTLKIEYDNASPPNSVIITFGTNVTIGNTISETADNLTTYINSNYPNLFSAYRADTNTNIIVVIERVTAGYGNNAVLSIPVGNYGTVDNANANGTNGAKKLNGSSFAIKYFDGSTEQTLSIQFSGFTDSSNADSVKSFLNAQLPSAYLEADLSISNFVIIKYKESNNTYKSSKYYLRISSSSTFLFDIDQYDEGVGDGEEDGIGKILPHSYKIRGVHKTDPINWKYTNKITADLSEQIRRIFRELKILQKGYDLESGIKVSQTERSFRDIYVEGNIYVTGNIIFQKAGRLIQQNINSLNVIDNLIILNQGETGAGVSEGFSGIRIDRGTVPNANFLYKESTNGQAKGWHIDDRLFIGDSPSGTNFRLLLEDSVTEQSISRISYGSNPNKKTALSFVSDTQTSFKFDGASGLKGLFDFEKTGDDASTFYIRTYNDGTKYLKFNYDNSTNISAIETTAHNLNFTFPVQLTLDIKPSSMTIGTFSFTAGMFKISNLLSFSGMPKIRFTKKGDISQNTFNHHLAIGQTDNVDNLIFYQYAFAKIYGANENTDTYFLIYGDNHPSSPSYKLEIASPIDTSTHKFIYIDSKKIRLFNASSDSLPKIEFISRNNVDNINIDRFRIRDTDGNVILNIPEKILVNNLNDYDKTFAIRAKRRKKISDNPIQYEDIYDDLLRITSSRVILQYFYFKDSTTDFIEPVNILYNAADTDKVFYLRSLGLNKPYILYTDYDRTENGKKTNNYFFLKNYNNKTIFLAGRDTGATEQDFPVKVVLVHTGEFPNPNENNLISVKPNNKAFDSFANTQRTEASIGTPKRDKLNPNDPNENYLDDKIIFAKYPLSASEFTNYMPIGLASSSINISHGRLAFYTPNLYNKNNDLAAILVKNPTYLASAYGGQIVNAAFTLFAAENESDVNNKTKNLTLMAFVSGGISGDFATNVIFTNLTTSSPPIGNNLAGFLVVFIDGTKRFIPLYS